ncbi:MAG: autoinducer binding domain-containing protein [Nitrospirae bacterium]|nr:autoinducer binding domain-containing protein [Nitrospirota bacterium]
MSKIIERLTRRETVFLLHILQMCAECVSREEFEEIVGCLKGLVPFEYSVFLSAHLDGDSVQEPFKLINVNYDPEWVELYAERKYHLVDPILKENFRSFGVQYWGDTYEKDPPALDFRTAAEGFGLRSGYTSGVRNQAGTRGGLFSFAGRDVKKCARSLAILEFITPHLFLAVERTDNADRLSAAPALSEREKAVLRWTAQGKTTWETAAIINIGERTVKFHVKNIMRKLNAVSRTQAAAVASELGLLDAD